MKAERLHAPGRKGQNVSEIRNTEPKPIQEIISDVMADIRKRANINYETATPRRETAIAKPAPHIDFEVGDLVQIRSGNYAGKCGRIIGVKYSDNGRKKGMITYTVKFSDIEAVQLPAGRMRFLSTTNEADI